MIDENQELEEQDLYEHLRIVVDKGQSLLRLDKFLIIRTEYLPQPDSECH